MSASGPLQDLRVLELGQLIAGPFCGQLMGDLGAEVIKVEAPGRGDPMRDWGQGVPVWWSVIARNKKSITLDLRQPAGQALLLKLVADADVLIENFRPNTGKMESRLRSAVSGESRSDHGSGVRFRPDGPVFAARRLWLHR